jgi:hypothetical protein
LGHSFAICPTPAERDAESKLPWSPNLRAPNEHKRRTCPPFAEGGYANFEYDVQYNDTFEIDTIVEVEQDGNVDSLKKDKHVIQPMGRGGGGVFHLVEVVDMELFTVN